MRLNRLVTASVSKRPLIIVRDIEPKLSLAILVSRAVAAKTAIRKDRSDITIEVNPVFRLPTLFNNDQ